MFEIAVLQKHLRHIFELAGQTVLLDPISRTCQTVKSEDHCRELSLYSGHLTMQNHKHSSFQIL